MTNINIDLIDHMGDDLRVANVARVSFNKWKEEFDEKDAKLIQFLAKYDHETPFRHCQISIRCEAPVFIARQLGKHQVGMSWNEVSRRYVDTNVELFHQKEWRKRPEGGIKQGSSKEVVTHLECGTPVEDAIQAHYDACMGLYETLLKHDVAPELARQVLPQSMMVSWVWTGSLVSFYNIYRLRSDTAHAQEEAADFANILESIIEPLFPECWNSLKTL